MPDTTPQPYARITLTVNVFRETDHGVNNPIQGYEPPYDYLVVREADFTSVEVFGDPKFSRVLEWDDSDIDPDGTLQGAVTSALNSLAPIYEEPSGVVVEWRCVDCGHDLLFHYGGKCRETGCGCTVPRDIFSAVTRNNPATTATPLSEYSQMVGDAEARFRAAFTRKEEQ